MAYELTAERRVELVDVAELLSGTLDQMSTDGVLIEKLRGWNAHGVRYTDPMRPDVPIREMTAASYAAEFFKVAGNSMDEADFDTVVSQCLYVGDILGNIAVEGIGFETIRVLAGSEDNAPIIPDDGRCR